MKAFLNVMAFVYAFLWEFKYIGVAVAAGAQSAKCGYDSDTHRTRGCEAMGLRMLQEAIQTEVRISKVRELSQWETFKLSHLGIRAGGNLRAGGWTSERIERKVRQIIDSAQEES
jgi:hypothetical protein